MSRFLTDEFKELVRQRTDIVSLIGKSVALKPERGGREFKGLCPFHDDHRPSMCVYPDRQSFRCWSCNEGGDCFTFVMKHDRLEFPEALEMLANLAGLEMPKRQRGPGDSESENSTINKNLLYEILAWAENEFHECLLKAPQAERARNYLKDRRLNSDSIARFRLGYHPANWEWLQARAGRRYSCEQLAAAKLIKFQENGNRYSDYFVDRVLFPIRDSRSRPVAFGGRVLPGSEDRGGKYFNSPESVLFPKSRTVYGLDVARDAIASSNTALVMEGYTDCVMAHQCGVPNVVATLGTALTENHVGLLKKFARKVVLVYDGDAAGQNATERSLPKFLAQEVDLRILTLPDNLDPDEFLLNRGLEPFRNLAENATEAWEKKLQITVDRHGLDSIDARHRVLQEMLEVLSQVTGEGGELPSSWQMRENVIIGRLAQQLTVPETAVRQQLSVLRSGKSQKSTVVVEQAPTEPARVAQLPKNLTGHERAERELIAILFKAPERVHTVRQEVPAEDLVNEKLRQLLEVCYGLADEGNHPSYERVTLVLEDPYLKNLAALVDQEARDVDVSPEWVSGILDYFRKRREQQNAAGRRSGPPEPHMDAKELLRRATEINQKRIIKKTLT